MKEKINQTAGRLKQTVRAVGVGIATLTASFFMSAPAYAAGVQDSQIVKGTEQLIGDVTTWLMVLAPVVAGLLIIYFCIRRGMTAFNTRELDAFIEELVRCYGTERAMYVLSRTIQFSDWDARFDQAVLDRAGKTDFPDTREPREAHQVDPTTRYVTEIDPCVVNAVFVKLMELEDEQEETNHMNEIEQDELDEDMTAEL